jgi:curved DNA-binding protein CbpA
MKHFTNCKTLEELKKAYRKAALANHPDKGGDPVVMAEINAEYEKMFNLLKNAHNANTTDETKKTTETAEEFKIIIEKLMKLHGLEIEICGSWLWITGDTFTNKDALKAAGCKYSKAKKAWHWHHEEEGSKWYKGKTTMDEIRTKYGSEKMRFDRAPELQGA